MNGLGVPELLIISVLGLIVPVIVGYWVIRLAVRHGVMDAQRSLFTGAEPGRQRVAPLP